MGFLWGLFRAVIVLMGVVAALLLVIDSALFVNLFRKKGGT